MYVLVINSGSSSIKFGLYHARTEEVTASGAIFRIGEIGSHLVYKGKRAEYRREVDVPDHAAGLAYVLDALLDEQKGALTSLSQIQAVGHRVVHGGAAITESVVIDEWAEQVIDENTWLAPLHNPFNLMGIVECRRLLPDVPQVAVFDTSYHQTMPRRAYMYSLPHEYYEEHGVRRYGFHGVSFRYVTQRAAELLGRDLRDLRMVACHLGNGVSITAIKNGESIDTSMGMCPLEGLVQGTRVGDLDPGVVLYMMTGAQNLSASEVNDVLYYKSGLLGLSGVSNDIRDIVKNAAEGDEWCALALDVYTYRIKKYVGAYAAAMGGIDALVFTAGAGENSTEVRGAVCEGLGFLGIEIDSALNESTHGTDQDISAGGARTPVLVVATNEELVILRDTLALTQGAEARA